MTAAALPPLDPNDSGTDIAFLEDIGLRWALVKGHANIAMAIVRRLSTSRGSLFYAPSYGFSVLDNLEGTLSSGDQSALKGSIQAECEKDDRIDSAGVAVQIDRAQSALILTIALATATGPFQLVLRVTSLTVTILNAGQAGAPAGIAAPADLTPTFQGPPGPAGVPGVGTPGPPGPTGPGGSSTQAFSASHEFEESDASGNELVLWQFTLNADNHPGGVLTANFSFQAKSPGGTTHFNLYVGGVFVGRLTAPGGGVAVPASPAAVNGAAYVGVTLSGTFTNPTGVVPVQITIKSPGAGVDAYAKECDGVISP